MNLRPYLCALAVVLAFTPACTAQASFTEAIVAELRSGRPADALRDASTALKEAPKNERLWTLKGLAARQLSMAGVAAASFRTALEIDPDYIPALESMCESLYENSPSEAKPYVDRLLARLPDEPNANGMAAMLAYRSGNYEKAAQHFGKAQSAITSKQQAMDAYADTLARLQRSGDCEAVLLDLVQRWPADKWARYNLAVLQSRRGANEIALKTLQPLIQESDEQGLSLGAALYEAIGETPVAVDLLRKAIAANPKDQQNYVDFATISFDHNSARAGITMLNAGLQQLPNAAPLYTARGILHMQVSEIAQGEQDFARANELDPAQNFGREAQSLSAIQRHNLPEALVNVKNSLAHTPDNAYLNYLAAEILKQIGAAPGTKQAEECLGYARKAVALDPKLVGALDIVGSLEFSAGHTEMAAQASRDALKLDPTDQEAVFRMILLTRRNGDPQHEVAGWVDQLKALKANEHTNQQRIDRYRLYEP